MLLSFSPNTSPVNKVETITRKRKDLHLHAHFLHLSPSELISVTHIKKKWKIVNVRPFHVHIVQVIH